MLKTSQWRNINSKFHISGEIWNNKIRTAHLLCEKNQSILEITKVDRYFDVRIQVLPETAASTVGLHWLQTRWRCSYPGQVTPVLDTNTFYHFFSFKYSYLPFEAIFPRAGLWICSTLNRIRDPTKARYVHSSVADRAIFNTAPVPTYYCPSYGSGSGSSHNLRNILKLEFLSLRFKFELYVNRLL